MFIPYRRDLSTRRADTLAVLALLATAFVAGAPILTGGYLTYLDNPPHLAELHAGGAGWSYIAFAGLSLDTLHSPLFWRALAHTGPLLEPLYATLVCLAIAAPPLALYRVARRRVAPLPALLLAYVLLVQRDTLVGSAAATGGMWTFYLAAAAWLLLADELARPDGDRRVPAIAALLGFIGLTHLYIAEAAALLVLVHVVWRRGRGLRGDALACLLALAAAAAYWGPMALVNGLGFRAPQNLALGDLARLLLLPTDTIHLLAGAPIETLPLGLEAIPILVLLAAGVVGAVRARGDRLARYGAAIAVVVLVLLAIAPALDLRLLGPNSWRFLYIVRLGAALAALPLLARVPAAPRLLPAVAVVLAASGALWGLPLRRAVPPSDGREMADVRALWQWLATHARGERVYLQDTFYAPPYDATLVRSHVLALTLHEAGVEPLGPYYGILPSASSAATTSEFGTLFGRRFARRAGEGVMLPTAAWAVTHVVTSDATSAALLAGYGREAAFGRFTVFAPPAEPLAPRGTPDGDTLAFELTGPTITAVAYHPFWRVREGNAQLVADPRGRIALVGAGHVVIEYAPPTTWPASVAGWLGIAALWLRRRRRAT